MVNPAGSTYLARFELVPTSGDVYQIRRTDMLEGAATARASAESFSLDGLAKADVESLTAFLTGPYFELHFSAFAQIFKINLGREPRAMEENIIAAVIRDDKTEAFIFQYFLNCTVHKILAGAEGASLAEAPAGLS